MNVSKENVAVNGSMNKVEVKPTVIQNDDIGKTNVQNKDVASQNL